MRDGSPKRNSKLQMRAVFVALIFKFQSVILAERTSTFRPKILDPSKGGFDNIRLADLLKIHLGVEVYYKIENPPVFA